MKRKPKLIIASMLMTGILIFTGCSKSDKSEEYLTEIVILKIKGIK